LLVQYLIGEVGEINSSIRGNKGPTPIFMDPGTHIKGFWSEVFYFAARTPPHNDITATFCRPRLAPVNVIAMENNLSQLYGLGDN
jgi:hypothetical protein